MFTSRRVARYTAICHHHAELVSRRLIARQASQMRLSHVALLAVYGVPSCFSSQLVVVLSRHTPEALETTLIGPGTANDRLFPPGCAPLQPLMVLPLLHT